MGALKVKDQTTGLWVYAGTPGPPGPEGPQGPIGVNSVIVGDFGAQTTPADLPPDGLLPVDWDGPGNPAAAFQMEQGWSLYYDKPADPIDGHLFQYVGTGIDPAGWLDIGLIQGPPGPEGPQGVQGVQGEQGIPGPPLPLGGGAFAALTKASTADQDVQWGGPITIDTGYLTIAGDGYGVVFSNGARIYKANGGGVTIRKDTNNTPVKIENNDGNGDRQIALMGVATNYNVTWLNGFSGTCQFRVNDLVVSCHMYLIAKNPASGTATAVKMCDYPAGVPAPWAQISVLGLIADNTAIASSNGTVEIQYRTDGVYLKTFSVPMNNTNHRLYGGSATWAR